MRNHFAVLFIFASLSSYSQSKGPNSGIGFSSIPYDFSTNAWNSVTNASASDDSYTNFGNLGLPANEHSEFLLVSKFSFDVPLGTTITGILVEIERSDPSQNTADKSIRLIKNSTIVGDDQSTEAAYPAIDAYQQFGSSSFLWGETWTPEEINESSFGVAISAKRITSSTGNTDGQIDHVRITVFYDFSTLPVKLINFSILKRNKSLELNWTTAEESNIDHYEIERSKNSIDFTRIQSIASLNQAREIKYSVIDENPLNGISYYRLKTIENNGAVKFSKIISIHFSTGNLVAIYPTVWKNGTSLFITNPENESLNIYFYTLTGQLLGQTNTQSNQIPTNPISNAKGILLFRIVNEDGNQYGSGKLLVN